MPTAPQERVIYDNGTYRLTATRLVQPGLTAELTPHGKLCITRNGITREVDIPPVPENTPAYSGDIPVLNAVYALAVDEIRRDITPEGLLTAGASWHSVWTRDVAYAVMLGLPLIVPEACRSSLESRVRNGLILQDTGTGGGWPISTDRVVWAPAAWLYYTVTGDREWLKFSTEAITATLAQDDAVLAINNHLRPGETSFIDWREQSYPDAMTPAEIGASYAQGTNILHYLARRVAAHVLTEAGRAAEAEPYTAEAEAMGAAIQEHFLNRLTQSYAMTRTGNMTDERTDALATALAVLMGPTFTCGLQVLQRLPRTPYGTPVFAPFKSDRPEAYHNRAVWPFVEAFVLLAHASLNDTAGVMHSAASLLRSVMAFGTCKENFHAVTGEAHDTLQNSDRQLWSAAGVSGMFCFGLFGIQFDHNNLIFSPCIPESLKGEHRLAGIRIRDMVLNIRLRGFGTEVCSFTLNGRPATPIIPLDTKGTVDVEITLASEGEAGDTPEYPAAGEDLPTPQWDTPGETELSWHPVPGADLYRIYANGVTFTTTSDTHYRLPDMPAACYTEYRIQAVSADNISLPGSAYEWVRPGAKQRLQPERIGQNGEYSVEKQQAWLDTRPCTRRLDYEPITLAAGTYRIRFRYCNATASLRDGDTCALRRLCIDGEPGAVIPFPHHTEAGDWNTYALTAGVQVQLAAGIHRFSLLYDDTCTNTARHTNGCMVRYLEITRLA